MQPLRYMLHIPPYGERKRSENYLGPNAAPNSSKRIMSGILASMSLCCCRGEDMRNILRHCICRCPEIRPNKLNRHVFGFAVPPSSESEGRTFGGLESCVDVDSNLSCQGKSQCVRKTMVVRQVR